MQSEDLYMIKRFVSAKSPQNLERAMLQNNARRGAYFKYDIVYDGREWFAWYLVDARELVKPIAQKILDPEG